MVAISLRCFAAGGSNKQRSVARVSRSKSGRSTVQAGLRWLSAPVRCMAKPIVGCFTGSRPGQGSRQVTESGPTQVADEPDTAAPGPESGLEDAKQLAEGDNVEQEIIHIARGTGSIKSPTSTTPLDKVSSPSTLDMAASSEESSPSPQQPSLRMASRCDSPDFAAMVAEALARLANRALEQAQSNSAVSSDTLPATNTSSTDTTQAPILSSESIRVSTASAGVVVEASSIMVQRFVVDLVMDELISTVEEDVQEQSSHNAQHVETAAGLISSSTSCLPATLLPSISLAAKHPAEPDSAAVNTQLQHVAADAAVVGTVLTAVPADATSTSLEQCSLVDIMVDELLAEVSAEVTLSTEHVGPEGSATTSLYSVSVVEADDDAPVEASASSSPAAGAVDGSARSALAEITKAEAAAAGAVNGSACSVLAHITNAEALISSPCSIQTASSLSLAELPLASICLSPTMNTNPIYSSHTVDVLLRPSSTSPEGNHVVESTASEGVDVIKAEGRGTGRFGDGPRGSGWWSDNTAFQELLKGAPTEPSQVCWGEWQAGGDLGLGLGHRTIISMPPRTTALQPTVLKIATNNGIPELWAAGCVGQEACALHLCRHPNVVPISVLGLKGSGPLDTPIEPSQVAYFGMPMADMSLRKNMGWEAWGRRGKVGGGYRGPSLFHLVKHAQAILRPLASVHRRGLLHRGLTPDHVLLFGKQDNPEAERVNRGVGEPQPIKYDVKLSGFGAAAKLNSQGYALQPSPYRCEAGYVPPEAYRGAPLTTTADVYQFGGVCHFMAVGRDPPGPSLGSQDASAGHQGTELPVYVPQQWRVLVRQCRQVDPLQRPTAIQLQLHLLDLLNEVSQAKQAARATPIPPPPPSLFAITMQPYQMATAPSPTPNNPPRPSWWPSLLSNPLYSPSSNPSSHASSPPSSPPSRPRSSPPSSLPSESSLSPKLLKSSSALARLQTNCSAADATQTPTALSQAAASIGSWVRLPRLMQRPGQAQQPTCQTDYRPVSSSSSSRHSSCYSERHAEVNCQPTAFSTDGSALARLTPHSIGVYPAKATDGKSAAASSLQQHSSSNAEHLPLQRHSSGNSSSRSEPKYTLQLSGLPNADVRKTPGGGLTAVFTPDWEELDLDTSLTPSPSATGLLSTHHCAVSHSTKVDAGTSLSHTSSATELLSTPHSGGISHSIKVRGDPAHLVATTAGAGGSRAGPSSPGRRAAPRRDDSALEQGGKGSWLTRTQGKAAALAANVTRKAADVMEQWSESQLSTRTVWPQ